MPFHWPLRRTCRLRRSQFNDGVAGRVGGEPGITRKAGPSLRCATLRMTNLKARTKTTAGRFDCNVAFIEHRGREVWQWRALESILFDLKLVWRRLKKPPGFTATVLLTLTI